MKMRLSASFLLAFCMIGYAASALLAEPLYKSAFMQFTHQHKKTYSTEEFDHRFNTFKDNMDFVHSFDGDFEVGLNQFSDLTFDEFKAKYLRLDIPERSGTPLLGKTRARPGLPTELDWRAAGAVTAPKDQGQCGSCWSFSATGSLEGCHFLKTKKLVSLSEQNLIDCSKKYGNHGCSGGLMTQAFDYIIENGGIMSEEDYPYKTSAGKCHVNSSAVAATMTGYTDIVEGDENDLQAKMALGPVSVAIDASHRSFQFYKKGVYNEPACSSKHLDHGVLGVGWGGNSTTGLYWIIKNSWGETWGDNGYILMSRNKANQCGVATMATIPHC